MRVELKSTRKDPVWFCANQLKVGEIAIDNDSNSPVQLVQGSDRKYLSWLNSGISSYNICCYTVRYLREDESIVITNK